MKKFDFYEFAGILIPGSILLFGLIFIYPLGAVFTMGKEFTIGELGLFGILAYATGHIIQTLGNGIESVWWFIMGGMPSDWLRTRKHELIAPEQEEPLRVQMKKFLKTAVPDDRSKLTKKAWYAITREIYAEVGRAGLNARIDIFNGNYGMFRGMSASLFTLVVLGIVEGGAQTKWRLVGIVAVAGFCALLRMHNFGVVYAREVYVQFLAIKPGDIAKPSKKEEGE